MKYDYYYKKVKNREKFSNLNPCELTKKIENTIVALVSFIVVFLIFVGLTIPVWGGFVFGAPK